MLVSLVDLDWFFGNWDQLANQLKQFYTNLIRLGDHFKPAMTTKSFYACLKVKVIFNFVIIDQLSWAYTDT